MNYFTKKIVRKHLLAWLGITLVNAIAGYENFKIITSVLVELLLMLGYMFIYYSESLFVFPKFYKKNTIKLLIGLFTVLFVWTCIMYFIYYYMISAMGDVSIYNGDPIYVLILNSTFLCFFTSMVAFGAYLNRKTKKAIEKQAAQESAFLIKQLGFLKNQFNPHIIFNFLNYCYSHIHNNSKSGAEAIELFSEMLAYTLDRNPDEPVLLEEEIKYISSYLKLQKILHEDTQIEFTVDAVSKNQFIIPGIFINFIENAFKHGDTKSKQSPLKIAISSDRNMIKLNVSNKKKADIKSITSTGIGNTNVLQQLELLYKNKFQYRTNNDAEFYSCDLIIMN
jgi:two-component system LytT family sensor kinase